MYRRQNNQNPKKNDGKNAGKKQSSKRNNNNIGNEALNRNNIAPNSISNEENNWIFVPPKKKERKYILVHKNPAKKKDLTGQINPEKEKKIKYNTDYYKIKQKADLTEIGSKQLERSEEQERHNKIKLYKLKHPRQSLMQRKGLIKPLMSRIREENDDFSEDLNESQNHNEIGSGSDKKEENKIIGQQPQKGRSRFLQYMDMHLGHEKREEIDAFFRYLNSGKKENDNGKPEKNIIKPKDIDYLPQQNEEKEIINENWDDIQINKKETNKKPLIIEESDNTDEIGSKISEDDSSEDLIPMEPGKKMSNYEKLRKKLRRHPAQQEAIAQLNAYRTANFGKTKKNTENINNANGPLNNEIAKPLIENIVEPLIEEVKNEEPKESLIQGGKEDQKEPLIQEGKEEAPKQSEIKENVIEEIKDNIIEEVKDSQANKEKLEEGDEPLIEQNAPEEDLEQIDKSLEPVNGLDFVVQKLPERKKRGGGTKFLNWLSYYTGKTIGKIGGFFAALGKGIVDLFRKGPGVFGGILKSFRGSQRFHEKQNPGAIPGWNDATFQEMEGPDNQVNVDFRRVPDVWSVMTAEKAAEGDEKDKNAKPRDPVISVYVKQTSDEYTVSNDGTGHSGIGIEYSRYSARAGRWQRYKVRFGYGIASMGASPEAKMAVSSYNNAVIPGRLVNEAKRPYDISRSYLAKPKQVNNVLRAAESYADRGGYNAYSRNCTTFAKEMLVDVAKIKGAENVFTEEDVTIQPKMGLKMFGAGAGASIFKADMENGFEHVRNKEDQSYENFGNYMVSRDEYERYKNSLKFWSDRGTRSYSPNAAAENLKRAEGGGSGQIGTYSAIDLTKNYGRRSDFAKIFEDTSIFDEPLLNIRNRINTLTPDEAQRPEQVNILLQELRGAAFRQKLDAALPGVTDPNSIKNIKQSDLVKGRTLLTDMIKNLNTLLFRYYKHDRVIQEEALKVINTLNNAILIVDDLYRTSKDNNIVPEDTDLGDLKSQFTGKSYKFTIDSKTIQLTPTQYEAWIQVCKDPQLALQNIKSLIYLMHDKKTNGLNAQQKKQLETLLRISKLAGDFINSHNYMIDKENFNQQDIDYALSLEKKERAGGLQSEMLEQQNENDSTMAEMKNPNASASGIYLMMIMKTVFGGMKERFKGQLHENIDVNEGINWLSGDVTNCIKNHQKEMTNIIRGLKHTTEDPKKSDLQKGFKQLLTRWLFQLFHEGTDKDTYQKMVENILNEKSDTMKETDKIITKVLEEA